ncbi:MAG: RIP metalloprotease RseP [Methylacidiphilales bacterium]|nr:RIP metalloprotease RseP [Candidatus Methylacidiphilales bacterium]
MNTLEILGIIGSVIGAFVVFSVTVAAHEWGHFLAARMTGLYIQRFAIGFGPKVFSFKRNGVEYCINWIPLGGFVQLPQMVPVEMLEGKEAEELPKNLPPVTPWAKIITAFWGPLFSFLLALALAIIVYFVGFPERINLQNTVVGYMTKESAAREVGIQLGDVITRINGREVKGWAGNADAIKESIIFSEGETIRVDVERNGRHLVFYPRPKKDPELENLRALGIGPADDSVLVGKILPGSPAEQAGLKTEDRILRINGEKVYNYLHIMDVIEAGEGKLVHLEVQRAGAQIAVDVVPRRGTYTKADGKTSLTENPMIGIIWMADPKTEKRITHPKPFELISNSALMVFRTLHAIPNPKSDIGIKQMSGPLGIFRAIQTLLLDDWRKVLYFGVVLNVNLALLNLFPLPILDGGHILLSIIELLKRGPVHAKLIYSVQSAFLFVLVGFALFVTYRDALRWGRDLQNERKAADSEQMSKTLRFEPHNPPTP